MINPDNRLFCRLDGLTAEAREQQRMRVMTEIGLLEPEISPVFEEATQAAAHFLDLSVCLLGVMDSSQQLVRSAVGLSRLGVMNELASSRRFPRLESFCTHVVDSHQILAINDTLAHPAFADSLLVHQYGIRAYLGVPLITSSGYCVGTLAVMSLSPHPFTFRDREVLALIARWSMSEYERQQGSKVSIHQPGKGLNLADTNAQSLARQLKLELLGQLTQELRTPLTSVQGMSSMLTREIYGPLTNKQKEYLDIIHNSSQHLLSLVKEILDLSELQEGTQAMVLSAVDVEMLCQQIINTLEQAAHRHDQQIRLSVEPGPRIWRLDKEKVRQMLYHLMLSVIQSSNAGSILRLHVSRKGRNLQISIWVSHPWLGEGLPHSDVYVQPTLVSAGVKGFDDEGGYSLSRLESTNRRGTEGRSSDSLPARFPTTQTAIDLGLQLCRQLAEMHGGQFTVQTTSEATQRYIISLPQTSATEEMP